MIPKVAWFHWSQNGPKLSWIRKRGVASFERLNPDWEVNVIETPEDIASRGIGVSHEADWTCWRTLAQHGGFVFDTDIVFVKPFPEKWLEGEIRGQLCGDKKDIYQFAAIGATPGQNLMVEAEDLCEKTVDGATPMGWETLGIPLLRQLTQGKAIKDYGVQSIPSEAFCFHLWTNNHVSAMWSQEGPEAPPEGSRREQEAKGIIGVHWYGGHWLSREMETTAGPDGDSWLERLAK